ncbi:hypothetical protein CRM22_007501 [Opisthorchis felineus]|uniref:Phosphatidic acid phosphatase type 2/haloperoxidase domain-containing protein n=1 Tax=Opisthorchis felineus TaxID=147828 RepID=A0A4S2LFS7_OPIFE|nr:hypothetical protein CRM22_007501 [Opisthorchis felineus]
MICRSSSHGMNRNGKLWAVRVVSDWSIIVLLQLTFTLSMRIHPKLSGFLCNDYSIRYPYHEDSVSAKILLIYAYLLPTLLIAVLEFLTALYRSYVMKTKDAWKTMAVWVYNLVTIYLISLGLTSTLTSVFKIAVGRPRPHFLDVCQPNITLVNCTGFINEYSCQGTRTKALHDMNLSFVSGHSSITAVTVTYVVLYLQKRLKLACAPMLRPVLQTAIVCFGLYVAISRFTDNKHHVTDIIGGVILGAGTALTLFVRYVPNMDEVVS